MRIKNWKSFTENIGLFYNLHLSRSLGPNSPELKLQNTISQSDTQVIMGIDGKFYTYDDYQSLYHDYLKLGGVPLEGFNRSNLDLIITSM
jgi:hypothetical protein